MRFSLTCFLFAALLGAGGCGRQSATGVSVDSTFRPYLSSDAIIVVQVNLEALKTTPFYQRHQAALQAEGIGAMVDRVGIDPRRDVAKLLVVWNGKEPLVLAKGHFPAAIVDAKLTGLGAQRTSYKNFTLFDTSSPSRRGAVTFIADGLAIAGPVPAVHQALDTHEDGSSGVPQALRDELAKIHKDDQVWEVSAGPLLANVPLPSNVESALSNISSYVSGTRGGFRVDSGVRLDAEITCISDEGAKRVNDALRGSIGLARLATNNNNLDLLRLWDSFKVSRSGQAVDINADLSPELVDKLLANAPQITSRARQELQQR